MRKPRLVIGNKNYSSWSLRAWLMLAKLGVEFEEIRVPLFVDGFKERLLKYSPAGKVPIYQDDEAIVWDSLAIGEYLAERHPRLWPVDATRRAHARSICAEMHAGFFALREAMPMNCRATERKVRQTNALAEDIRRVQAIWRNCRSQNADEGPWLFGSFSIADAMYAPVVSRFNTYGVSCDRAAAEYVANVLADSELRRWYEAAAAEVEVIEKAEVGLG